MITIIEGGRRDGAQVESSYEKWDRIRQRGIILINTNPLRMFWLHDLFEWHINRSHQLEHLKSNQS